MSGILPNWLEQLLGVDSPGAGEGTLWSLETAWPCGTWVTLLFVVCATAWIAYFYAQRRHRPVGCIGHSWLPCGLP